MKKQISNENGQTLIMVIFAMIIVLTIGLALASRSVTNLKVSKQNEESQRALQAAEAGIEQSIKLSSGTAGSFTNNNSTYTTTVQSVTDNLLNQDNPVEQDKGIEVWLSDYPNYANGITGVGLTVNWGQGNKNCSTGVSTTPALEVALLLGNINSPTLKRYVFDPCGSSRTPGTSTLSQGSYSVGSENFKFSASINDLLSSTGIIMMVTPLYNDSKIALTLSGSGNLPSQGKLITSTGASGDTKRTLTYFLQYPQIPAELFPYSVISQGFVSN